MRIFLKKKYFVIAIAIISLLIILLASASILFSQIYRYKQEITQSLSEQLGLPLKINTMQTYWLGIHPTIILKDVQIFSGEKTAAIRLKQVKINILVLRSILERKLVFNNLELSGGDFLIKRSVNNIITINGVSLPKSENSTLDFQVLNNMNLYLYDIHLTLEDETLGSLQLHNLDIHHSLSETHFKTDHVEIRNPFLLKAIKLDHFTTKIILKHSNSGWLIYFNDILLKNDWLHISGKSLVSLAQNAKLKLALNYAIRPSENILSWLLSEFFSQENSWIQSLIFRGNKIQGKIELSGPLQPSPFTNPDSFFRVSTHFDNFNLYSSNKKSIIEELTGELFFEYPVIKYSKLSAKILGEPFKLDIDSLTNNNINVRAEGSINTKTLKQIPNSENIEKFIVGNTKIHLTGNMIKNQNGNEYLFKISSDLYGLNINLFDPINKKQNDINSIELSIEKKPADINFLLSYQNKLSANLLILQNPANEWYVDSGNIFFGNKIAPFPNQKGIWINGNIPRLDLMDLISLLPKEKNNQFPIKKYFPIRYINLNFNNLLVADYPLNKTKFVTKYDNNQWLIDIDSKGLRGILKIPSDLTKTIFINLKRVLISSKTLKLIKQKNQSSMNIKPQQIPSLNINCKNFYFDNHNLGMILLKTHVRNQTLFIDNFAIMSPNINLKMTGSWQNDRLEKTFLEGHAIANNFGDFLKEWKISESLLGANGNLDFKLYWPDDIYHLRVTELNGFLTFSLKDGVILDVVDNRYELLGSILNVFSIDSLEFILEKPFGLIAPKRKGFDFEVEKVNFKINKGMLITDDFYLHGKLAEVEAYGKIDLVHHLYDMHLEITPFLTSYLPMNLALAGGPAVLGMVRASDKLIGGILNRFFKQYYYVTGPWTKPHYQKLDKAAEKIDVLKASQVEKQRSRTSNQQSFYKGYHD